MLDILTYVRYVEGLMSQMKGAREQGQGIKGARESKKARERGSE